MLEEDTANNYPDMNFGRKIDGHKFGLPHFNHNFNFGTTTRVDKVSYFRCKPIEQCVIHISVAELALHCVTEYLVICFTYKWDMRLNIKCMGKILR